MQQKLIMKGGEHYEQQAKKEMLRLLHMQQRMLQQVKLKNNSLYMHALVHVE